MKRVLYWLAVLPGVAGCSSPEKEQPVDLQPGTYEVTVGGGTIVALASGQRTDRICFQSDNAVAFPREPLSHIIEHWDDCSDELADPKGNAISGARKCTGGEGHRRKVSVLATFSGSHSTDSFKIEGAVSQGEGEGGGIMRLGSGDFTITGHRVGDC
jgi:hypothetical protein